MNIQIVKLLTKNWSGKRDLNPRPLPWQGNALPSELFPRTKDNLPRYLTLCKLNFVDNETCIFYHTDI